MLDNNVYLGLTNECWVTVERAGQESGSVCLPCKGQSRIFKYPNTPLGKEHKIILKCHVFT